VTTKYKQLTLEEAIKYDVVSSTVSYVGKAVPGVSSSSASWQIRKLVSDASGSLDIYYANGSADYTNIWNNRTSLSYS
jgi:hypothetical protein